MQPMRRQGMSGVAAVVVCLFLLAGSVQLLLAPTTISALRARDGADAAPIPPKRLVVAVLGLENQTGDPNLAHWRYAATLLGRSLGKVQAVRILSDGAVQYAFRQVGLRPGEAIDPNHARSMGEQIEAQRVVWGSYSKKADLWQVRVRMMNVATGAISPEFSATAGDWYDIRDKLNERILAGLGITPSLDEKQKAAQRWTRSAEALDWSFRVQSSQNQGRPGTELETLCRKAIAADPNCALAYCDLAATLANQGKLDLAEEAVGKALHLQPDSAQAHAGLGWIRLNQARFDQAESQLRQAHELDPDDAEYLLYLAATCLNLRKSEEGVALMEKAVAADPTNPQAHSGLAQVYAVRKRPEEAMRELAETRRCLAEGPEAENALFNIAKTYETLGRPPEALEYYERLLPLAQERRVNPDTIRQFEKRIQYLKSMLIPTFIQASMPRRYSEEELETILRDKLTESERAFLAYPFACTEAMKQWAQELTRGTEQDLDKAKAIFDGLATRFDRDGPSKSRNAREVFEVWKDPKVRLVCMDHAVLFVALARAVNVSAFLVSVTRLPDGTARGHACAAVFAGDRALLADSAFRWFGAPHKQYAILDDLQATAALCFINRGMDDPTELAAYRAGSKLWPDWPVGRSALVAGLIRAGQLEEARQVFAGIPQPQSEDYDAAVYWSLAGEPAIAGENWDRAKECLLKSISIWPDQSYAYFGLGRVYVHQQQLADARTAFRSCLRNEHNEPNRQIAHIARAALARINEEIGLDSAPGMPEPQPKENSPSS